MYPLLLKPETKDYLWGGTKLKTEYGFYSDRPIMAEGWMLSCHKDGTNTVLNGELKGKSLTEAIEVFGKASIGKNAEKFSYFPILIKLIDANQKLSIQVHPDNDYALKNENEYGKTEMWYVVDCIEGAELIYGFKKEISEDEFKERIENNTLTEVTNNVKVHKGDIFFIESGTLHAIGEGILIAEVQQNSNTTYRVSDYGRLDKDGNPRPLHIEKAIDVTKRETPTTSYGQIGNVEKIGNNTLRILSKCEFFNTMLLKLNDKYTLKNNDSFVSAVVLSGTANIYWKDEYLNLKKGDSIFIPANFETILDGNAEILLSCV